MQSFPSPLTFAGLVLLQVLQILFIVSVPVWVASWVYKNKASLLPLGWVGILGALYVVWPQASGPGADWKIPLFIGGFVIIASLIQFLQYRRIEGRLWRFVGMNGWVIGGILLLYLCFWELGLDFTSVITRQTFDGYSRLSGDFLGTQTTYYLGPYRISAAQAEFSSSLYACTFPLTLIGISIFQPSLDLIWRSLISRKKRA